MNKITILDNTFHFILRRMIARGYRTPFIFQPFECVQVEE